MKKLLIILSMILVTTVGILFFANKTTTPETPVNKEISLAIYTDNNYSSQAYDAALATVHVTVTALNGKKENIIWQKDFSDIPLKDYPDIKKALTQTVSIPNELDTKEKLMVSYTITYNTKGSILQIANGTFLTKGSTAGNLFINV